MPIFLTRFSFCECLWMFLLGVFPFQGYDTAFYPNFYVPSHVRLIQCFTSPLVCFFHPKVTCATRFMQLLKYILNSSLSWYHHLVNSFKVRFGLVSSIENPFYETKICILTPVFPQPLRSSILHVFYTGLLCF